MSSARAATAEAAILNRLVKPDLPLEVAQALLQLDLDQQDRDRMHELAVKNQEGELKQDEQEELDRWRRVGLLVDIMRSKARLALKMHGR